MGPKIVYQEMAKIFATSRLVSRRGQNYIYRIDLNLALIVVS